MVPKLLNSFTIQNIEDYTSADIVQLGKWLGLPRPIVENQDKVFDSRKTSITNCLLNLTTVTKPEKRRKSGNVLYLLYYDKHKEITKLFQNLPVSSELRQLLILYSPSPTMKQLVAKHL